MKYSAPPWNPKHLMLQDRPDKYGGEYNQEELDKIIKRANKNGQTMIYWGLGNKLNVRKEMKRINEMKEKIEKKRFYPKRKVTLRKVTLRKVALRKVKNKNSSKRL